MRAVLSQAQISDAFLHACRLDVEALKPGNVHIYAPGHGMTVDDFLKSAEAAAPIISNRRSLVGQRIRSAVDATFDAVGCNTNLGILLLTVPLAAAFENDDEDAPLTERIARVLDHLGYDDAIDVFRAIARARPAGLGHTEEGDVSQPPPKSMSLLEAMRLAASRDLVAAEYASGFARVQALCFKRYQPLLSDGVAPHIAMSFVFCEALTQTPDSHIVRKHGKAAAETVRLRATELFGGLPKQSSAWQSAEVERRLLEFDAVLKNEGLNPGSLADLMVAVAFLCELSRLSVTTRNQG